MDTFEKNHLLFLNVSVTLPTFTNGHCHRQHVYEPLLHTIINTKYMITLLSPICNSFRGLSVPFLALTILILLPSGVASQDVSSAWDQLNGKDIFKAIKQFEAKDDIDAKLTLAMLYARVDRKDDAIKAFEDYYNLHEDPVPAAYALLYHEAVLGQHRKRSESNKELLNKLMEDDSKVLGNLKSTLLYNDAMNAIFDADLQKYQSRIQSLEATNQWSVLGPFDNVMNCGFDRYDTPLQNPQSKSQFTTVYGGPTSWHIPTLDTDDGYLSQKSYFAMSATNMYAQTFVTVAEATDVILNLGYSGTAQVWLNDQLVYSESESRTTGCDDYQIATSLSKGTNRILVQLGAYKVSEASFIVRLTDMDYQPIQYDASATYKPYQKATQVESKLLPHFAIAKLEAEVAKDPDNLLNLILVAKAYRKIRDVDSALKHLKRAEKIAPLNYLVVRELNLLHNVADNNTEVSKYYGLLKKHFPNDYDIYLSKINDLADQSKRDELAEEIKSFKKLYPSEVSAFAVDSKLLNLDEDYVALIALMDKMYTANMTDPTMVDGKYRVEKAMGSSNSSGILELYLEDNFDFGLMKTLASDYIEQGTVDKAIELYESCLPFSNRDESILSLISEAYTKMEKFDKADKVLMSIAENTPTNPNIYDELATISNIQKNKKKALRHYEKSLSYYPFDFMLGEKCRELKGKKTLQSFASDVEPSEIIKKYESMDRYTETRAADIVYHNKTRFLNKWGAFAYKESYIMKMNQESALEDYQSLSFESSSQSRLKVIDVQAIKPNGNEISAEAHGKNRVFVNLEVGDYIYVNYLEYQTRGGKTSSFQYDNYGFDSYYPSYNREFVVVTEDKNSFRYKIPNGSLEPSITKEDDVQILTWSDEKPVLIKDEPHTVPYNDFARNVQITSNHTWNDIVDWYRDLSSVQAKPDYAIKSLVAELELESLPSDLQKAQKIYDYVVKNIQYSSIDFRQSSYVPQLASKVYHTRLGDCKDVSTLYATIAREVGLNVDLVLINTSNNGTKDIIDPSLNFNHCIVKLYTDTDPLYLELTDPDLPFGHLYSYHHDANILDIPYDKTVPAGPLKKLRHNAGYSNSSVRETTVTINEDNTTAVSSTVDQTGTLAALVTAAYVDQDEGAQKEVVESWLGSFYKSVIELKSIDLDRLTTGSKTATYSIAYELASELTKIGSFYSLKIPFHEAIAFTSDFQAQTRTTPIDYKVYENADSYLETINVKVAGNRSFLEVPEDQTLSYKDNQYKLTFNQLDENTMTISRSYHAMKDVIEPDEYPAFRAFILSVIEAEQTQLIIK